MVPAYERARGRLSKTCKRVAKQLAVLAIEESDSAPPQIGCYGLEVWRPGRFSALSPKRWRYLNRGICSSRKSVGKPSGNIFRGGVQNSKYSAFSVPSSRTSRRVSVLLSPECQSSPGRVSTTVKVKMREPAPKLLRLLKITSAHRLNISARAAPSRLLVEAENCSRIGWLSASRPGSL